MRVARSSSCKFSCTQQQYSLMQFDCERVEGHTFVATRHALLHELMIHLIFYLLRKHFEHLGKFKTSFNCHSVKDTEGGHTDSPTGMCINAGLRINTICRGYVRCSVRTCDLRPVYNIAFTSVALRTLKLHYIAYRSRVHNITLHLRL